MTHADWELSLATLLTEISSLQDELLNVLRQKRSRMAGGDVGGMDEGQVREEALGERLEACLQRRTDLLASAGRDGLVADNLFDLAARVDRDPGRGLAGRVRDTSRRMRLVQDESLTNWVLAQRSLLHVSQLLEIIATGGRLQPTYLSGDSVHARGALVDQEA